MADGKDDSGATFKVFEGGKKKKSKSDGKASKSLLYSNFRAILDDIPIGWPALGRRYEVVEDARGQRTFVEFSPSGVVRHVAKEALCNAIGGYSINVLSGYPEADQLALTFEDASKIVSQWAMSRTVTNLKDIAIVKQKSEPGLCWHRLPFDLAQEKATPLFDEMMQRTDNSRALMAWIGSLFDTDSPRQQYVWLYGHGMNGKGSLLEFLKKVFGPAYKAEFPPDKSNRFWTDGLKGARVVAFPDCTDFKFVQTGLFKSLTGGDAIRTEEKGGKSTTSDLFCKIIFGSNDKPLISRGTADTRRVIFCEMAPLKEGTVADKDYAAKLWQEAPTFLASCVAVYKGADNATIQTSAEAMDALIQEAEEESQAVFTRYFEARAEAQTIPEQVLWLLRKREKMSDIAVRDFKKFLEQRYGIKRKIHRHGNSVIARYDGMAIKKEVLSGLQAEMDRAAGKSES